MLKSAYEGLNARPKVYLSKEYFCEMYPTCVSSELCEFIHLNLTMEDHMVLKTFGRTNSFGRDCGEAELKVEN